MSVGRIVLLIIAGTTVLRLVLAGSLGLGVDESYMVSNARIVSLSYFDHPPLHVWLTSLAGHVLGGESPLAVRLPFALLFAGSTWLLYRLTATLFGASAGLWAAIAFNLAPVFSVADGMFVLPDGPLIFFLLAAANVVAGIVLVEEEPARPTIWWTAAGALTGLALLSKYSAVFFLAGTFVFLLTVPSARRWLRTPGPWVGVAAAAVLFVPVVIWNLRNGFAAIDFQTGRFADPSTFDPGRPFVNLIGQGAYLTPWLFLFLAWGVVRGLAAGPDEPKRWFPALLAIGPIAMFTILALWVKSFPHWSMPGWLFAFPLLGYEAVRLATAFPRTMRGVTAVAIALSAIGVALMAIQGLGGGIRQAGAVNHRSSDPTVDLVDWTALPAELKARGLLGGDLVVGARDWTSAGKVSYVLPGVPVLCLCQAPHHFAFRDDPRTFLGRNVVLVFPASERRRADVIFPSYFESLTPLDPVEVRRAGEEVLELDLLMGNKLRIPATDGR